MNKLKENMKQLSRKATFDCLLLFNLLVDRKIQTNNRLSSIQAVSEPPRELYLFRSYLAFSCTLCGRPLARRTAPVLGTHVRWDRGNHTINPTDRVTASVHNNLECGQCRLVVCMHEYILCASIKPSDKRNQTIMYDNTSGSAVQPR